MKLLSLLACTALFAACSSTKHSAPAMSEAEMMAAWKAAATPGPEHKALDPLVGTFKTVMKSRMSPEAPWTEETGTCENRWVFGGRFLEMNYRGTFDGQKFEGRGLMGYDNTAKQYVGFWSDNFSTGLVPIAHGQADASGKVITTHREFSEPMTGQWCKMREVVTIESPTSHKSDMYCQMGDAPEYHSMSLQFTR